MPDTGLLQKIAAAFPGKIVEQQSPPYGYDIIVLNRDDAFAIFATLRDHQDFAFNFLSDLTAIDFLGQEPRFELVYQLYSIPLNHRLQVKIRVPEDDAWASSVSSLWKSGNWLEREVWDMFGIKFTDHPDLRRILMYEEFKGYPLRKDYPVNKRQPLVEERDPITNPLAKKVGDMAATAHDLVEMELDPTSEVMSLQMGPSHPATHGTIKFWLKLDGEKILNCDVEIGYLHRGFEKMCEQRTWNHVVPYTDRLNYISPLINNVGFALAAEKLLDLPIPERCQYIRMIMSEISRMTDHFTCLGMAAAEAGALSVAFYALEARETLFDIVTAVTGARLTVSYTRVGGVTQDLPEGFADRVRGAFVDIRQVMKDCDTLLSKNRIFIERMSGVGAIPVDDVVSYGVTGPLLRACGVAYDVRKAQPYLFYDRMDFTVPTGTQGDNYDRFSVRFEEIRQSMRIIEQALEQIPTGPVRVDDPRVTLPQKKDVYGNIEGLMNHFKLVIEGVRIPKGDIYQAVEGANGELGFYLVSDGSGRPYRVRVRPPCFFGMAALGQMLKGCLISDIITTFGMINMIGGECDR